MEYFWLSGVYLCCFKIHSEERERESTMYLRFVASKNKKEHVVVQAWVYYSIIYWMMVGKKNIKSMRLPSLLQSYSLSLSYRTVLYCMIRYIFIIWYYSLMSMKENMEWRVKFYSRILKKKKKHHPSVARLCVIDTDQHCQFLCTVILFYIYMGLHLYIRYSTILWWKWKKNSTIHLLRIMYRITLL